MSPLVTALLLHVCVGGDCQYLSSAVAGDHTSSEACNLALFGLYVKAAPAGASMDREKSSCTLVGTPNE